MPRIRIADEEIVYSPNKYRETEGIKDFDHPYFEQLFDGFVFPDGGVMQWESLCWLQKRFMKWLNRERLKNVITFPVETLSLLNDGEKFVDQEWADFAAEMYAEGHSFFTYTSDSVDSLASCCRLRNGIQDNQFSYTLGAGGVSTGSKCVMTINVNRLVQNTIGKIVTDDMVHYCAWNSVTDKAIREAVSDQVEKVHKYLLAFNSIVLDMRNAHMIPIYDAGFVTPEKQYLTVGINGLVEAAEYLGIKVGHNEKYRAFVHAVLEPIYEANKAAKTNEIMFNTEYVPSLFCGHNKLPLIDLELSEKRQQGASVMAA